MKHVKIYGMLLLLCGAYILGFRLMWRYFQSKAKNAVEEAPQSSLTTSRASPNESPLIVFTCRRASYLSETLDGIFEYIPRPCAFGCPVIVSQDGEDPDVETTIIKFRKKFATIGVPLIHIRHKQTLRRKKDSYRALSEHYGWAISEVFNGRVNAELPPPGRIIILEEDLRIAPDFFGYMASTSKILDKDPSLLAVSAFNDNGHLVNDPKRLVRSDFFPGLGWMMTRSLWKDELEAKWPEGTFHTHSCAVFLQADSGPFNSFALI